MIQRIAIVLSLWAVLVTAQKSGTLDIGEVTTDSIDTSFTFDVAPTKLTATLDQKDPFKRLINAEEMTMTDTTRKFDNLTPLTDYTVEIAGSDGAGAQVALKKDVQTKGPPVNNVKVDATEATGTKATVTFDEVTGLKDIQDTADVEVEACPADKTKCVTQTVKAKGGTTVEFEGLTPGTEYTYSAYVKNPANDAKGPPSEGKFTTAPGTGEFDSFLCFLIELEPDINYL
eukprot:TCONS_00002457-protein